MPAGLVDAVDRHLHADQGGLAAGRRRARQRLQRAELERLGLPEGVAPRRGHEHRGAERAGAPPRHAEEAAPRDLAAVPECPAPTLRSSSSLPSDGPPVG